MKFILSEKYLLSERLLLEEPEDAGTQLKDQITELADTASSFSTTTTRLTKALATFKENAKKEQEAISKQLNDIAATLKNNQNWNNRAETLTAVKKYVKAMSSAIVDGTTKTVPAGLKDFEQKLKELQTALELAQKAIDAKVQDATAETALASLRTAFDEARKAEQANKTELNAVISTSNRAKAEKKIADLTKLADGITQQLAMIENSLNSQQNWASSSSKIAENIKTGTESVKIKLEEGQKQQQNLLNKLERPSKTTKYIEVNKLLDQLTATYTELQSTLQRLSENLVDWRAESSAINAAASHTKVKTDWDKLFAEAGEKDTKAISGKNDGITAIWDRYFAQEWKGYDRKVLDKLTSTLLPEISAYGYSTSDNPFFVYLKKMLKDKDFLSAVYQNPASYSALHNAAADDIVTENDLLGRGALGENNIIFDGKLFKTSYANITTMLTQQAIILKLFPKFRTFAENDGASQSFLAAKYENDLVGFVQDTFYIGGNPTADSADRVLGSKDRGLKTSGSVQKIVSLCFDGKQIAGAEKAFGKSADGSAAQITADNLKEAVSKMIANLQKNREIDNKETYLKAFLAQLTTNAEFITDNYVKAWSQDVGFSLSVRKDKKDLDERLAAILPGYSVKPLLSTAAGPKLLRLFIIETINQARAANIMKPMAQK